MSLITENVIPGKRGKIFATNASEPKELEKIRNMIMSISGVSNVSINSDTFPKELIITTSKLVKVKQIEEAVIKIGFHAIPKGIF